MLLSVPLKTAAMVLNSHTQVSEVKFYSILMMGGQ